MIVFNSGIYRRLELFPETEPDGSAGITLQNGNAVRFVQARNHERVIFELALHTTYSLSLENAATGLIYLSDCAELMEKGIRVLEEGDREKSPLRFAPFKGWMGAPCGLCAYGGFYHMFYEWNPFSEGADNLYWGHAVSRDLTTWKHLPVLFAPPRELQLARFRTGGAFSGSAEVMGDRVRLFFTQSLAVRRTGAILRQYQMQAESRDMLHFSEEVPVLLMPPVREAGPIFCAPKVTEADGERYMVVGSTWKGKAAMLLYRENKAGWEYIGPFLKEKGATEWNNPDFFPLGKTYAALGTFGGNIVRWYTGSFGDGHFRVRARGILDFGGDFSAPQTFTGGGRRLMIGRIGRPDGSGCASLPREVFARNGRIRTKPCEEVYARKGECIYEGQGETLALSIKDNAFMATLCFSGKTDFSLCIGKEDGVPLYLHCKNDACFFEEGTEKTGNADVKALKSLTLFADDSGVEVFINDGEATGTKGICGLDGTFRFEALEADAIESISVFRLCSDSSKEAWDEGLPAGETFEF